MTCGNLIFVRGRSPLSFLIRLFDGEFSHVAISLGDGVVLETQYLTNTVIRKKKYNNCEVLDLGLSSEQRGKIKSFAIDSVGKFPRYDYKQFLWESYLQLFGIKSKNKFNSPKQVICSEILIYLLQEINWFDNEEQIKYLKDLTPNQLYQVVKKQLNKG